MADHDGDTTRGTTPAGSDPIGTCLTQLAALLGGVADEQAWRLDEETLQVRLGQALRVRSSVEELTARLTASVVERDLPRLAGATRPGRG